MDFVVMGEDAAGMSAASRAKRKMPDLNVTDLEISTECGPSDQRAGGGAVRSDDGGANSVKPTWLMHRCLDRREIRCLLPQTNY